MSGKLHGRSGEVTPQEAKRIITRINAGVSILKLVKLHGLSKERIRQIAGKA